MIETRFDAWPNAACRDQRVTILRVDLPQVPSVGEIVNLRGDPYIVHLRGWSIADGGKLYAYVDVFRAGTA